ncbi:MAG: hypothetical protein AAGA56_02210, partial [Myxococcota bacterium]
MSTVMALLSAARPASGQVCVAPEVKKELRACPVGARRRVVKKKRRPVLSSVPVSSSTTPKKKGLPLKPITKKAGLEGYGLRDDRGSSRRSRRLLVAEIVNVEQLYRTTKKRSDDRPRLLRRLAEGFVELEASAFRDQTEAETAARAARSKVTRNQLRKKAREAAKVAVNARKKAISYYRKWVRDYPKWCQYPSKPEGQRSCTDEVLYYLAYEYERAREFDKARRVYLQLVEHWKGSRFLPYAYLAFGELFFSEAQSDPTRWSAAEKAYRKVLSFPRASNKLWGYAAYKKAYVHWNRGDYDDAVKGFTDVIKYGQGRPGDTTAQSLARSARRDLIPVYALSRRPEDAYRTFTPLSGHGKAGTIAMMEALGQNLLDTGRYADAITLYEDLMARQPQASSGCHYQAQVTRATMALRSGDKRAIFTQLQKQRASYAAFAQSGQPDDRRCANDTASLVAETAMAWHLEAVGSGGVRGTNDAQTMALSADLYEMAIGGFTSEESKRFRFPRLVKEDWPTLTRLRYLRADLLYVQSDWERCGPAFDAVVKDDPQAPEAAEAAFTAALCYQRRHRQRTRKGGDATTATTTPPSLAPLPLDEGERDAISAYNRYLCYVEAPAGDGLESYVDVAYARARTYFGNQHWGKAALAFREIALRYPQLDAADSAAALYLRALGLHAARVAKARTACHRDMRRDLPRLVKSFCAGGEDHPDTCRALRRTGRDLKRLEAEEEVRLADAMANDERERTKRYERAARLYVGLWRDHGEAACTKEDEGSCAGYDEILYNAARAYQAARLVAKAIAVRRLLVDPRYHLQATEPARRALYELGANYQAIAVYDEAARWYEKFANENRDMKRAPDALSDAVVLRLGLGQADRAIANAKAFRTRYGPSAPHAAKSARIAFALAAHYANRERWTDARDVLNRRAMSNIDTNAEPDVQLQARALLGRIYNRTDNDRGAAEEFGAVQQVWKARGERIAADLPGRGRDGRQRLGRGLSAVGEALYFFAERERARADAIGFPRYRGKGDAKDVDRFIKGRVKKWIEKKRDAIERAQDAYLEIKRLKPAAPPRWVVAAG